VNRGRVSGIGFQEMRGASHAARAVFAGCILLTAYTSFPYPIPDPRSLTPDPHFHNKKMPSS